MCVEMVFYSFFWLPISIAQGIAIMPIVAVLVLPAFIISELVFAPIHAIHSFYVIIITERLGVNLKLFGTMVLPLFFLALPLINILLCLLAVIVVTPFSMVAANTELESKNKSYSCGHGGHGRLSHGAKGITISPTCIFFGGAPTILRHCISGVSDAIDLHRHAVINGLNEFKTLGPSEEKVRPSEGRSDELPTLVLGTKAALAPTFIQDMHLL